MKTPSLLGAGLALLLLLPAATPVAAQSVDERLRALNPPGPVAIGARWSLLHERGRRAADDAEPKTQSVVRVGFHPPAKGREMESVDTGVLATTAPAARHRRHWRLIAARDGHAEPVDFALRAEEDAAGGLQAILLIPDKTPSPDLAYSVELVGDPGALLPLRPGWKLTNPGALAHLELDPKDLKIDQAFISGNKALESEVALHAGESAAGSARAQFGFQSWNDGDPFRFQGFIEADGTWRPEQQGRYLNSIVAELDGVFVRHYGLGSGEGKLIGISEIGGAVRLESDQEFEKVNGVIGVTWWNSFNAQWLQDFGQALCFTRNRDTLVPTPIFAVAYDYVFDIHDDLTSGRRATEVGQHRLRGRFYWSVQLAHALEIPYVSAKVGARYDLDLLIDVGGIYELESGGFKPDTRLSLELAPASLGDSKPSFTLTYVNGKTTPRFESYDAIFAGIKLPF